jgi:hypothetical protein
MIERGRANTLRCPIYEDGVLLAPTALTSTVTITDAAGQVQVDAAAVTVTGSVATYSYTPASTLPLGEGWVVSWSLALTGHDTVVVRNDAALCRVRLTCPVSLGAIYQIAPALNPRGDTPITAQGVDDHDEILGDVWDEVQRWLISQGRRPWLSIGAHALYDLTRWMALARIWSSLAHRGSAEMAAEAARCEERAREARQQVRLTYDEADDAAIDAGRKAGRPGVVWLGSGHQGRYGSTW